jgi:membrane protein implicated in regulation of membrane protease activity
MLIGVAILLLIVAPSPWNLVAFGVLVPLWVLELLGWNRTVKRRRQVVGAQTLIDQEAVVITPCQPDGQVRVGNEIWAARCDAGARTGDRVLVTGRNGLTLTVEPTSMRGASGEAKTAGT